MNVSLGVLAIMRVKGGMLCAEMGVVEKLVVGEGGGGRRQTTAEQVVDEDGGGRRQTTAEQAVDENGDGDEPANTEQPLKLPSWWISSRYFGDGRTPTRHKTKVDSRQCCRRSQGTLKNSTGERETEVVEDMKDKKLDDE